MPAIVKDLMWSPPMLPPDATIKDAAAKMTEMNCGALPVGSDSKIEGIITDRDIVIRCVSNGKDPDDEKVSNIMTTQVCVCKEDDTIEDAAALMKENKISRLAVVNDDDEFAGIVSFGHIFRNDTNVEEMTDVVARVAGRNGQDRAVGRG